VPNVRRSADIVFPTVGLPCSWTAASGMAVPLTTPWPRPTVSSGPPMSRVIGSGTRRRTRHSLAHGWTVIRIWEHVATEEACDLAASVAAAKEAASSNPSSEHPRGIVEPAARIR
jgi:hypothetical protein